MININIPNVIMIGVLATMLHTHQANAQRSTALIDPVTNNGGFENGTTGWTITNGTQANKWQVSTGATAGFSGTACAYISQSASPPFLHTYVNTTSVAQIYQDVTFPAGDTFTSFSFKAIVQGEACCDYLRVYLAPTTVTPVAGTNLGTLYQVGGDINMRGAGWTNISLNIPSALIGNTTAAATRRLIFQWRNDGSGQTQPPIAVDDITLVTYSCSGVTLLNAGNITNTSATLNWTPIAGATGYEVRYKKITDPATVATWATPATVAGGATGFLNITGLTATQEYEFQVRALGAGVCPYFFARQTFTTLCLPVTYAALPYTEDFENWINACNTTDVPSVNVTNRPSTGNPSWRREDQGTSAAWTSTNYLYSPVFFNGAHSARFHSGNTPAGTYGTLDFYVNCSSGTGNKELRFARINTNGTDSLRVLLSTDSGATFNQLGAYLLAATWTEEILTITSNSPKTIIRFIARGDNGGTDIGLDYVRVLPPCAGMPVAGSITPVPAPCRNQPFRLAATGTSNFSGITYQWQDSTAAGWQNSVGASANQAVFTTTVTTETTFRLLVTCVNSNQSDASQPYTVTPAPFINCYCAPTYATGAAANTIRNVAYNGMVNASTGAAPWYSDFTGQQPGPILVPTLVMGKTDTLKVTFSTNATNYSAAWIDFDHNGVFDAAEYFSTGTNAGASGIANIAITPPLTAVQGRTRLRIRGADRAVVNASQACGPTSSAYGEAEDYYVFIEYPVCNGVVDAGIAVASDTAICKGYTVNITDTTYNKRTSQTTRNWQSSADGGLSWNDVPNSTGKDTLNDVLISGSVSYRLRVKCNATGDTSFSIPANINVKPPYKCYCYSQSDGGSNDISDIGGVVIGTMTNLGGGPHVLNPQAIRRRTDFTEIPGIEMRSGARYKLSVYHIQRNAVHKDARVSVFIDFNNDLRYDANALPNSELVYSGVTTSQEFYLDTAIRIPSSVIPDVPTGMRIIINDDLNPLSPANLGCGPYTSGETEDYVVTLRRTPQSVGTVNLISELSVYPNPTSDNRITVDVRSEQNMGTLHLSLLSVDGKILRQEAYDNIGKQFKKEIELQAVSKGVYFIEVHCKDGGKNVRRVVIM